MASSFASKNALCHSFPRSEALRALVDTVLSEGSALSNDLVRYEKAYELIKCAFSQKGDVHPPQTALLRTQSSIFFELGLAAQEIAWAEILVRAPLEPYFSIANILREALCHSDDVPAVSTEHSGWIEAVKVAVAYERNRPNGRTQQPGHKDTTFARAILFFIGRGVNLRLSGETLILSPDESHKFAASAYRPLMAMGDVKAMKVVEDLLCTKFDGKVKRLHLHPNPDMMGQKMDRSIPYGYLYRVALKTLGKTRTSLSTKEMAEKAIVSCTNFGAVFNVEPFSHYEMMFAPHPGKVLEVLREIIVYDELFTIPQCAPDLARPVIHNLFMGIDIEGREGWSTEDAMVLLDVLLATTMDFVRSVFIKRSDLLHHLSVRVGDRRAQRLFRSFVLGPVNTKYEFPANARQAETRECMLVRASKGYFWVPGQLFLVPAFYNRMITLYSHAVKDANSIIGKAFERHFEQRIKNKLIPYMRGDYGSKRRIGGDLDLVIQTDETIVLFELKKKN